MVPDYEPLPTVSEQNFLVQFVEDLRQNRFDCRKDDAREWIRLLVGEISPEDIWEELEYMDKWDEIPFAFVRPCRFYYKEEPEKTYSECEDTDEYEREGMEPDPQDEFIDELDQTYVRKYAIHYKKLWQPIRSVKGIPDKKIVHCYLYPRSNVNVKDKFTFDQVLRLDD